MTETVSKELHDQLFNEKEQLRRENNELKMILKTALPYLSLHIRHLKSNGDPAAEILAGLLPSLS